MNRLIRSLRSPSAVRRMFNLYPPYLMTGIRVERIDADWRRIDVAMPLRWYNRNYFGTHFGGSLYAMTDPFFVFMLVNNLGPDYFVIDQGASIRFQRPGRGRVRVRFSLTDAMLDDVRTNTAGGEKYLPTWPVEVTDEAGDVVARVEKTLYVRRKPRARPAGAGNERSV